MAQELTIQAKKRNDQGTGKSKQLRAQNQLPAILYGGKKEPQQLLLDTFAMNKALATPGFTSHILTLDVEGSREKVIIKDVQWHPARTEIMHIDIMRISSKDTITMTVGLNFVGEDVAPGVKKEAGVISHMVNSLEIKCLPADLPESIEVDLSDAVLGQVIHVLDLKLPKGVELAQAVEDEEHNFAVASVHAPKIVKIEEEETAEHVDQPTGAKAEDAG